MRVIILCLVFAMVGFKARAQTWAEWFDQKRTQLKYLGQQIAANKVYLDFLEKGYSIAKDGLQTIEEFKSGEFNLHLDYFNSLQRLNPKIRNWTKIASVVSVEAGIIKMAAGQWKQGMDLKQFTPQELGYFQAVFEKILKSTLNAAEDLLTILNTDEIEMGDADRLKRIDQLYEEAKDIQGFTHSFSQQIALLSLQRQFEKVELEISKRVNGLK